jgi:hypothetical protein
MANNIGTNPMSIDTAGAILKTPIHASAMTWETPTTVGHKLIINDSAGNPVINVTCKVSNENIDIPVFDAWLQKGLTVAQIDSGKFFIYQ